MRKLVIPQEGIKLNLDMANMSMMNGSVDSISHGKPEEYVTTISFVLPYQPDDISAGDYLIEDHDHQIKVRLQVIKSTDDDPIMKLGKGWNFGTSGTGVPSLPFKVFTDNRGEYPCVLATLVFPYRLASWIDPGHESGIYMGHNYEEVQVTGPPDVREKIIALTTLNSLLKSKGLKTKYLPITYELVTVFTEMYFRKPTKQPLVLKLTALASKTAYKDAVEEHCLKGFDRQKIEKAVIRFTQAVATKSIENENDLLELVVSVLSDILAHHIENRRWIDAFWDGERKIKHDGEEISIPRQPKNETRIQPTLHVVLDIALSPIGVQVIRESDEGIGTIDFRCLYTTKDGDGISVGIEFKLAHHKEIREGIRKQLPAYLKAIRSTSGIFSVMWFKDQEEKYFKKPPTHQKNDTIEWLKGEAIEVSDKNNIKIISLLIDASIKPSASKIA